MALGVEMLLQSMGFDPKEVQSKFVEARDNMAKAFNHFDSRLTTIEKKIDALAEERNVKVEVMSNGR